MKPKKVDIELLREELATFNKRHHRKLKQLARLETVQYDNHYEERMRLVLVNALDAVRLAVSLCAKAKSKGREARMAHLFHTFLASAVDDYEFTTEENRRYLEAEIALEEHQRAAEAQLKEWKKKKIRITDDMV